MPIKLEIVTAEKVIFSDDVDIVVAPGQVGQLGILPQHAPLMTILQPGELVARKGGEEFSIVITGGFLEARPDRVIVLADAAERASDIDAARAEAAKARAQETLKTHPKGTDSAVAEAALRRALVRLRVAEKRKRKKL
jgi:F-type H+-transporting ATPase subunit epsilon